MSQTRSSRYRSCETTIRVPGPAVEQVLEGGERVGVEVVGRLVEEQDVGLADEEPEQLQPSALAARQVAHGRAGDARGEPEPLDQLRRRELLAADDDGPLLTLDHLEHPQVRELVEVLDVLAQLGDLHGLAALDAARGRLEPTGQEPQQRRLAGAVDADQADAVAGAEPPGDVVQEHPVAVDHGRVLDVEHVLAEPRRGHPGQRELVARRRLVGDQLVRRVEAELGLGRPRRCTATQPGELLAQQVLALLLGRRRVPCALGPRQDVGRVAALVLVDAAVVHLPRARADGVEEPAVVRDDDERTLPAANRSTRCSASHATPSTSRWLVGSSRTRTSSSRTSSAARATRRRWPPESESTAVSSETSASRPACTERMRESAAHSCSSADPCTTSSTVRPGRAGRAGRARRPARRRRG